MQNIPKGLSAVQAGYNNAQQRKQREVKYTKVIAEYHDDYLVATTSSLRKQECVSLQLVTRSVQTELGREVEYNEENGSMDASVEADGCIASASAEGDRGKPHQNLKKGVLGQPARKRRKV